MTANWPVPAGLHTASARLPVESRLPSFDGATGWLNSPPLTAAVLRGKVVLVNFWTYTCINWLRQLPYLRAWSGKYSGHGLVVIGVHTPEFRFEHNLDNVRRAVQDMRVDYPVAIDNGYGAGSIWLPEWLPRPVREVRIISLSWSPVTESNRRPSPYHGTPHSRMTRHDPAGVTDLAVSGVNPEIGNPG